MDLSLNIQDFFAQAAQLSNQPEIRSSSKNPKTVSLDIRRSIEGDQQSYRRLIEQYQGRISAFMWRFSRDRQAHEELVQDVFVEAWFSLKTYNEDAPFFNWLATIATRVGYKYFRQLDKRKQTQNFTIETRDIPRQDHNPNIDKELIYKLLKLLPARDRLVLTLRYLEGCDVEQTARRTGWSQSMVKVQTWRAKSKFKKLIEKYKPEF